MSAVALPSEQQQVCLMFTTVWKTKKQSSGTHLVDCVTYEIIETTILSNTVQKC